MDVAIAGAHGKIGRELGRLLADRGDHVRGLIRNPNHGDDLRADGIEPVVSPPGGVWACWLQPSASAYASVPRAHARAEAEGGDMRRMAGVFPSRGCAIPCSGLALSRRCLGSA